MRSHQQFPSSSWEKTIVQRFLWKIRSRNFPRSRSKNCEIWIFSVTKAALEDDKVDQYETCFYQYECNFRHRFTSNALEYSQCYSKMCDVSKYRTSTCRYQKTFLRRTENYRLLMINIEIHIRSKMSAPVSGRPDQPTNQATSVKCQTLTTSVSRSAEAYST